MNGASRTQTQTSCTIADLEAWCAAVQVEVEPFDAARYQRIDRTYPPCIGCGGPVYDANDNATAATFEGDPKTKTITTVTFHPCGCVLAVHGHPEAAEGGAL